MRLKHWYDPVDAHIAAQDAIMQARTGILSNEADIQRINKIITPLIKNGQSVHQAYLNHVDELMCSEKTLYNYVDACLFDVRNIDLPRKVKCRPRYGKFGAPDNHVLIRRVIPKENSFNELTQKCIPDDESHQFV